MTDTGATTTTLNDMAEADYASSSQSSTSTSATNTNTVNSPNEISVSEDKNPEWVNNLLEYFEFCDKQQRVVKENDKDRKRDYFTLKCLLCEKMSNQDNAGGKGTTKTKSQKARKGVKTRAKTLTESKITGCNASSFARHLQRNHEGEHSPAVYETRRVGAYKKDYLSKPGIDSRESIEPSIIAAKGPHFSVPVMIEDVQKYDRTGVRQKGFNTQVLDFITTTGLPFSLTETEGFRRFVYDLNPKLSCPSRKTVIVKLADQYGKIVSHLRTMLRGLQSRTAHLVLDIWSSRQKVAVIGVQVRFIKDGKIQQYVLGFKQFEGSHDAASIKQKVQSLLKDTYGLSMTDFLTVTADNASAILCAFKAPFRDDPPSSTGSQSSQPEPAISLCQRMINETQNSSSETQGDVADGDDDTLLDVGNEQEVIESSFINDEEINTAIDAVIKQWCLPNFDGTTIRRNSCLAHLLQLGIRDALRNAFVAGIISKVNTIITWFHKSNKQYMELRRQSKLGLLKPCETRWNSTYYCLKRICTVIISEESTEGLKKTEPFACIINRVLDEAKVHTKKVPQGISPSEIESIRTIIFLLEPFAELTDDWQGDGVTASKVILGLIDKIKDFDDVEIPDISDESEQLIAFKAELRRSVWQRFETNRESGQKVTGVTGADRNIVTCDVFNEKNYILATILDPRLKLLPFTDSFHAGTTFKNGCCSREKATEMLNEEFLKEKENECEILLDSSQGETPNGSQVASSPGTSGVLASSGPGPAKKRKRDMFARVQEQQILASAKNHTTTEVQEYLRVPEISIKESPVRYWHANKDRFPVLSFMAHKYLAMPASSASVERLFSVAGSIISSRRASMTIDTAEKIIFYREYLRQGLPGF